MNGLEAIEKIEECNKLRDKIYIIMNVMSSNDELSMILKEVGVYAEDVSDISLIIGRHKEVLECALKNITINV